MMIRWLARCEDAVPSGDRWLTRAEAASVAAATFTKRRMELLLRRLVVKHAVAAVCGLRIDEEALARVEVCHEPTGAPYVLVDGSRPGFGVSVTDRAGWGVCAVGDGHSGTAVGDGQSGTAVGDGHSGTAVGDGHTGTAVGDGHTGTAVGCDLELVEPRSEGFVRDFFSEGERRYLAGPAGPTRAVAANVIWSAKESALKALGTGLDRDTRSVEVGVGEPSEAGWGDLTVRCGDGPVLRGWWRHDGAFVLTVVTEQAGAPPVALEDPLVLTAADPRATWLNRPLRP